MCRSVTSDVSALSGLVANGHRAVHSVSSSPSEIPYGGFSPVRLQTGLGPSPSSPGAHPAAYRRPVSLSSATSLAPRGAIAALSRRRVGGRPGRSGPEALGSSAGCSVPPGRRLLWPHPRLRASPTGLWFSPTGLCLAAEGRRFPALFCWSFRPCRLPYPGGSGGDRCFKCHPWQPSPICEGLGIRGSHAKVGSRVAAFRGCTVRFMLRPGRSLALHRHRTFTFELSSHELPR
jgi:hypothetical protein